MNYIGRMKQEIITLGTQTQGYLCLIQLRRKVLNNPHPHNMENPTPKYLSEQLIEELKGSGVIRKDANLAAAQLIIRKYFIEVYTQGGTEERMAHNRKTYTEPKPDNL